MLLTVKTWKNTLLCSFDNAAQIFSNKYTFTFLFYETLSQNKLSDVKNATHFLIEGQHSFELS